MARFLLISLLSVVSLLAIEARPLSHAGLSTAEVFWTTVLPDSPLPDALFWFLHPETTTKGKDEVMNLDRAGDNPFWFYHDHKPSSKSKGEVINLDRTGDIPFWFYHNHKHSAESKDEVMNPDMAGDKPLNFYSDNKDSSENKEEVINLGRAGDIPSWFYHNHKHSAESKEETMISHEGSSQRVMAGRNEAPTGPVMFFHEEVVRVGEILKVYFPRAMRSPLGLLPRDVAESIPFATSELPGILARFGIAAGSVPAFNIEKTLGMCETPLEVMFCATSLEALVEGAIAALGTRDIRPVTSTLPRSGAPLQPYTIRAVRPIDGSRFVACHSGHYPYTVYMCHDTGDVRAYMADIEGANGGGALTLAIVCHTDTSLWNPEHVSFKQLGTKPGGKPVCHYMAYGHIMFAKNNAIRASA